jgi:hypothetical protein
MTLCNYQQNSFFKTVFDPVRDFNYRYTTEMTEAEQQLFDPVGFYYFHKPIVYALLAEFRLINKRRMHLRDLLREMDRIWRANSQQRVLLNETDWRSSPKRVAERVSRMVQITRRKIGLEERAENSVTGDIQKHSENAKPLMYPTVSNEKQSSILRIRTPRIDPYVTPMPFLPIRASNNKVYPPRRKRH